MGLKYIYAGYSKCGTKTMAAAFKILGYKCMDIIETLGYCSDRLDDFFSPGFSRKEKIEFLREMLKDIDVVLDNPWFHFWEELLEAFPDARCIGQI